MIRILEIRKDGTYVYEADTKQEEQLFEALIDKAIKLGYQKGYEKGYNAGRDQARSECLSKLHKIQDQLLARGISPIYI